MFDRFKKSRPEDPKAAADTREPVREAAPSIGGFGRRQTPHGGSPASGMPPRSAVEAPSCGFGKRPATAKPSQTDFGASQAMPKRTPDAEAKNDVSKEIIDWLMVELKDGRGVHCETMLTVLGALAGFAAQQSVWAAALEAGVTPKQAFTVIRTKSGESFYLGEALNRVLAATSEDTTSVWQFVAKVTKGSGAERLPDLGDFFKHTSSVIGTERFGVPRLPPDHMPRFMPREAVNRYWPKARSMMEHTKPELWPMWLAIAAAKMIVVMKEACDPGFACFIVMEAAVPMSKIDPATVPKNSTRH